MSPLRSAVAACALAAVALTGCITGERPTLADEADDLPTGDAAVDDVLSRLDTVDAAVFTASFQLTNNFGGVTRDATVIQAADGRRSVTVGDIRFLTGGPDPATCDLAAGSCTATIDDALISDLQSTHQFYGESAARRLRLDATRNTGASQASTADIAGQPATCVTVPLGDGSKLYCALDSGVLARYQGPDVTVEMTAYDAAAVDESLFTRP